MRRDYLYRMCKGWISSRCSTTSNSWVNIQKRPKNKYLWWIIWSDSSRSLYSTAPAKDKWKESLLTIMISEQDISRRMFKISMFNKISMFKIRTFQISRFNTLRKIVPPRIGKCKWWDKNRYKIRRGERANFFKLVPLMWILNQPLI